MFLAASGSAWHTPCVRFGRDGRKASGQGRVANIQAVAYCDGRRSRFDCPAGWMWKHGRVVITASTVDHQRHRNALQRGHISWRGAIILGARNRHHEHSRHLEREWHRRGQLDNGHDLQCRRLHSTANPALFRGHHGNGDEPSGSHKERLGQRRARERHRGEHLAEFRKRRGECGTDVQRQCDGLR